jgi:hypothetical protein
MSGEVTLQLDEFLATRRDFFLACLVLFRPATISLYAAWIVFLPVDTAWMIAVPPCFKIVLARSTLDEEVPNFAAVFADDLPLEFTSD